jgi:hypothetical protein
MRTAALALPLVLLLGVGVAAPDDPDPEQIARGKQIFETVCAGCHTVEPPPDSAPPMAHVVRHLRMELKTYEAFAEHVRSYVSAPAAERSLLPPMAIERFGLMGALPMGDSILTDVAAYLWTLGDSARPGRGKGMKGGGRMGPDSDAAAGSGGRGMKHRRGAEPDSEERPGGRRMMHRHGAEADSAGTPAGRPGGGMCRMKDGASEHDDAPCGSGGCRHGASSGHPGGHSGADGDASSCCAGHGDGEAAGCCGEDGGCACAGHGDGHGDDHGGSHGEDPADGCCEGGSCDCASHGDGGAEGCCAGDGCAGDASGEGSRDDAVDSRASTTGHGHHPGGDR